MPIVKRWSKITGFQVPDQLGIYELGWSGNLVYIGQGRIADRITRHTTKAWSFNQVRYEVTNSKQRAEERERAELRNFGEREKELPKYNSRIG